MRRRQRSIELHGDGRRADVDGDARSGAAVVSPGSTPMTCSRPASRTSVTVTWPSAARSASATVRMPRSGYRWSRFPQSCWMARVRRSRSDSPLSSCGGGTWRSHLIASGSNSHCLGSSSRGPGASRRRRRTCRPSQRRSARAPRRPRRVSTRVVQARTWPSATAAAGSMPRLSESTSPLDDADDALAAGSLAAAGRVQLHARVRARRRAVSVPRRHARAVSPEGRKSNLAAWRSTSRR